LAKLGLIAAIDTQTYRDLSMGNRNEARRLIKAFTSHNDKLGFDFSNVKRKYGTSYSEQFASSAYPAFLKQAAKFY